MAIVHKKKDGRVFCVYLEHGRRIWEAFGRGPEADRAAETRRLEIELEKRKGIEQPYGQVCTFAELIQDYLDVRKAELAASTIEDIIFGLARYFLAKIGGKNIDTITLRDWNDIQMAMEKKGLTRKTINKHFRYVSKILNWAVKNGYGIRENPWRNRESLKESRYRVQLFTIDEFRAVLAVAPDHLAVALKLAYYTGARPGPSELFAIKYTDCDWRQNRIHIHAAKTDTWRWQYIDATFMQELRDRMQTLQSAGIEPVYICNRLETVDSELEYELREVLPPAGVYLLRWEEVDWERHTITIAGTAHPLSDSLMIKLKKRVAGMKMTGTGAERITTYDPRPAVQHLRTAWDRAKRDAGITRRLRMYDIRHFHITYALAAGAPIADVAERVGHVDTNMIVRNYLHMVDELRTKRPFDIPALTSVDKSVDNETPSKQKRSTRKS